LQYRNELNYLIKETCLKQQVSFTIKLFEYSANFYFAAMWLTWRRTSRNDGSRQSGGIRPLSFIVRKKPGFRKKIAVDRRRPVQSDK